jgi:hypothetical protein
MNHQDTDWEESKRILAESMVDDTASRESRITRILDALSKIESKSFEAGRQEAMKEVIEMIPIKTAYVWWESGRTAILTAITKVQESINQGEE